MSEYTKNGHRAGGCLILNKMTRKDHLFQSASCGSLTHTYGFIYLEKPSSDISLPDSPQWDRPEAYSRFRVNAG